jgi:O-antigen/teichoic acid export membrane protein
LGAQFPPQEVGYYNTAMSIFEIVKSLPSAIINVIFPELTRQYALNGVSALKALYNKAQRKLMLVATPLTMMGLIWSHDAIRLAFGASFAPAGNVLNVLLCLFLFICLTTPAQYILYATEKHQLYGWISPLTNLTWMGFLFYASRAHLGLASVGTALSLWIVYLLPLPFAFKKLYDSFGVTINPDSLYYLGVGIVSFLLIKWITLAYVGWAVKIAASVLGLAFYFLALFILKKVSHADFKYFSDLINPMMFFKNMLAGIRREKSVVQP